jgi:hypothetical protein
MDEASHLQDTGINVYLEMKPGAKKPLKGCELVAANDA